MGRHILNAGVHLTPTRMGESHMHACAYMCIILRNRRPIVWVWCRQNLRKMRVKRRAFIQRQHSGGCWCWQVDFLYNGTRRQQLERAVICTRLAKWPHVLFWKRGERLIRSLASARKLQSCRAAKLITSLSLSAERMEKNGEQLCAVESNLVCPRSREDFFCGRSTYITALFPLPAAIVNILNKNIHGSLPAVMSIKYNQVRQSPFCVLCAQCHCV